MATTKITADQLKRAIKLGLKAKDADGVKKELIKKLKENEVDGVEGESIDELFEMFEAFHQAEEEETEEEEESTEEEEVDELAEEESEEEEAPAKKAAPTKKATTAPAAKAAPAKTAAAPAKKEAKKAPAVKYTAWDGADKANKKAIQAIIALFPEAEIKWLKQGITVFYPGKSSKKAIISFDRLKIAEDGTVVGDLFFNALKGKDEVHQHVGEDREYKHFNSNLLFIPKMSVDEAVELLEEGDLITHMNKTLASADKRAVANREKLEEKIAGDKTTAPAAKASTKIPAKAKAAVEEEEAEEEEETPAPKKKAAAPAAPAKKAAKVEVEEEEEAEEEEEEVVTKKAPAKVAKKK